MAIGSIYRHKAKPLDCQLHVDSAGWASMHVPARMKELFRSLEQELDPIHNLRALNTLIEWMKEAEIAIIDLTQRSGQNSFQEIGNALDRPRQAIHRSVAAKKSNGLTSDEFDGVTSSTLRYWLAWWSDPLRTPDGFDEAGRDPATEKRKVRAELEARQAAGIIKLPIKEAW